MPGTSSVVRGDVGSPLVEDSIIGVRSGAHHWPLRLTNAPGVLDMSRGSILKGTIICPFVTLHIALKGLSTK